MLGSIVEFVFALWLAGMASAIVVDLLMRVRRRTADRLSVASGLRRVVEREERCWHSSPRS